MSSKIIKPRKGKWIVKLEKLQECQDCHDFFTDSLTFKEHLKDHQQETRIDIESQKIKYQAIENESEGTSKSKLLQVYNEIFNENGEKVFQCKECANVYSTKNSLHKHYASSHREKKFKCDKCSKMFSIESQLRKHFKSCHIQNGKMKNSEMFKEIIKDDGSKEFQCNKCDSAYDKKGSVRKHFHSIHRERKFKCEKCSKMFPIESNLRNHSKTCKGIETEKYGRNQTKDIVYQEIFDENGEKMFKCYKCESSYENEHSIRRHFNLTHREKKIECEKCGKIFAYNTDFKMHLKICDAIAALEKNCYKILKSDGRAQLQCNKCQRIFSENSTFLAHYRIHEKRKLNKMKEVVYILNKDKKFQCNSCENVYTAKESVEKHFLLEHEEKKFKCDKCGKRFSIIMLLHRHLKVCDGNDIEIDKMKDDEMFKETIKDDGTKEFLCRKCDNSYEKKESVRKHFHTIHREKKYKCDKCSKMFPIKSILRYHLKKCNGVFYETKLDKLKDVVYKEIYNMNGVKEFQCNKCENVFTKRDQVGLHFYRKHKEKKFKCEKCNETFPFKSNLKNHEKICDQVFRIACKVLDECDGQKFQCVKCQEIFPDRIAFHVHLRAHRSNNLKFNPMKNVVYKEIFEANGKKKFQCNKCENIYKKQDSVRRHFHVLHEEKKFKCDKCSKMFSFITSLRKHLKICNRKSSKNHTKIDMLKDEDIFKYIYKDDGENQFQCIRCELVYRKKDSVRKHFHIIHREKKFKCDKCSKMFPIKSKLIKHLKTCNGVLIENYTWNKMKDVVYKIAYNENGEKEFQCYKCENTCKKVDSIRKHVRFVHSEKKFKCEKCNKMFAFKSDLIRHGKRIVCDEKYKVVKGGNGEKLQCLKCEENFSDGKTFHVHFRIHQENKSKFHNVMKNIVYKEVYNANGEKEFQCNKCENVYKKQDSVRRHFNVIHKEKKFKCEKCVKKFAFKSNLKIHLKSCSEAFDKVPNKKVKYKIINCDGTRKIECMKCEEIFSEKTTFLTHFKMHKKKQLKNIAYKEIADANGDKKFPCCKCEKVFEKRSGIIQHINLVHKEKNYKCEKCTKRFASNKNLKYHMIKCDCILRSTKAMKSREINYKIIELDLERKFQCIKCQEMFNNRVSFQKHYRIHLEKKFKCDNCSKMFVYKSFQETHTKFCGGPKSTNYNILESGQEKRFQCINCQKIFSKLGSFHSHYNMHHREKAFQCEKCHETFAFRSYLNNHIQKCDGSIKTKEVKPTYRVFVDWDAQKKYQCDLCDETFTDLDTFHQHFFEIHYTSSSKNKLKDVKYKEMFDNDGKKKYQCLQCEKTYSASSLVLQHIYQIHREKKHKCEICNKSFTFLSKLKIHLGNCSGSNNKEPEDKSKEEHFIASKVEVENANSRKENDSTEKNLGDETFNVENKDQQDFKTEFIPEHLKPDDNEQDLDENDPLQIGADDFIGNDEENLSVLGI